jgi:predicted metalloprotease with PDZ domain
VAMAKPDGMPPPIRELFVTSMDEAGVDVTKDIRRFIERGETISLPGDAWAPCGAIETSEVAVFERGFDGPRTIANGNVVAGVDPNGPAHAAGLRDGMRLRKLDLSERRDSRVRVTYTVYVDGGTREISYLPAGKRKVTLQELKMKPMTDDAARKACAARLGGNG